MLSYEVGVSSTFSGEGVVDFGLTAGLPNTAKVSADVSNKDKSAAVGFDGGSIDPFFDVKSLSASVDLVAYSKAKISFGIEVVKVGKLDVAVSLQVPKITTTLTAAYGEHLLVRSPNLSTLTRAFFQTLKESVPPTPAPPKQGSNSTANSTSKSISI